MSWFSAVGVLLLAVLALVGVMHVLAGFDRRRPGDLAGTVVRYEPQVPAGVRRVIVLDQDAEGVYRAS